MSQDLGIDGYGDADLIAERDGAAVYRCRATRFDRDVVVKVVAGNGFDPKLYEQETRALRAFSDTPNVARVLDAGISANGERYTAMEYAPRGSVADQMSAGVAIPFSESLRIATKTARAVASVHDAGLVHGNITPTNVLIDLRGEPLLSDIGSTTITGTRRPSVAHAAPEVLLGQKPNTASDIYALGSTIYSMLAGFEPFADVAATAEERAIWKRDHDPRPLSELGAPQRVSDIVARCMARRPSDRYASARIVAEALAHATPPANENGASNGNGAGNGNGNGHAAPVLAAEPLVAAAPAVVPTPAPVPVAAAAAALDAPTVDAAAPPAPSVASTAAATAPAIDDIVAAPGARPATTFVPLGDMAEVPQTLPGAEPDFDRTAVTFQTEQRARRRRRSRGRIAAVLAVVIALIVGGVAIAVVHGNNNSAAPPPSTVPRVVHHANPAMSLTFPTVQLGTTPALVSQLWSTTSDRRVLTSTIGVSNASRSVLRGTLRVVVPKAVSQSLNGLQFVPHYSAVISADPKVAYRMVIPPGGRFVVHWVVHYPTALTPARFKELAKDQTRDLANDAKSLGAPIPKPVAVALSVDPNSAILQMTDANRQPKVALHVTESFSGFVLHDPVLWQSTNPSVADVDANGLVTGFAAGNVTINATVGTNTVHAAIAVQDHTTTTTVATHPGNHPTSPPGTQSPPRTTATSQPPRTTTTRRPTTTTHPTTTTQAPTTTTEAPTTTTTTTPRVPANPDVNGDGVVGCIDAGLVNDYIGTTNAAEDINGDGVVNSADLAAVLADYTHPDGDGTTRPDLGCPPP
jgi:tRNA A-37 threonylcarbamoyl transferase component Bud32